MARGCAEAAPTGLDSRHHCTAEHPPTDDNSAGICVSLYFHFIDDAMRANRVAVVIACVVFVSTLASLVSAQKQVSASSFMTIQKAVTSAPTARAFVMNTNVLGKVLGVHSHVAITDFPITTTEAITLDLKPGRSPIDARTECWISSDTGDVKIATPTFFSYRGKVLGEPDSRVALVATGQSVFLSVVRESGIAYALAPAKNQPNPQIHLLVAENDLLASGPFYPMNCIADDIEQPVQLQPVDEVLEEFHQAHEKAEYGKAFGQGASRILATSTLLQPDIAVEADNVFFKAAGGNVPTVLAYIGSLFAMSSSIYEDEANITWHLSWVKIWDTPDPYNVAGNAYALEDTVPKYWKSHYQTVQRDVAHVMTSLGNGGGGYGLFSLCDPNYSYSMSSPETKKTFPTFAFTYDAYIVAHEIGHNFSLPHSHSCYWNPPLDTCWTRGGDPRLTISDACDTFPIMPRPSPGSIMSYCANANYALSGNNFANFKLAMTFTHRVDTVLRANAEKAACVTEPTDPTLILLSPRGSDSLENRTTYPITWTMAHVQQVNLEFSPDGGGSWTRIVSGLPSTPATYSWHVPDVASKKMLVRVYDPTSSSVGDTSLLFFTITVNDAVASVGTLTEPRISPNPASRTITILGSNMQTMTVLDILGHEQACPKTMQTPGEIHLDVAALPPGTYVVEIDSKGQQPGLERHSLRFVKE